MATDPLLRGRLSTILGAISLGFLLSCSDEVPGGVAAGGGPSGTRYTRDLLFVGEREERPIVVAFRFTATEGPAGVARSARGWLAQDSVWDGFLDEEWSASTGGVWRILPRPALRVLAGGAGEIEALVYRRGARHLRLQPGEISSSWSRTPGARFRASEAWVRLGADTLRGHLLEMHRVERSSAPRSEYSALLTDRAGTVLYLVDGGSEASGGDEGFQWSWDGRSEPQLSAGGEILAVATRRLRPTGIEAPTRWRIRLPATGAHGELVARGHEVVVEPDGGVSVHYTVEGWVHDGEERRQVKGSVRAFVL